MAVTASSSSSSSDEGKPCIQGIVDGTSFKLLKPTVEIDEVRQHFPLDIFPLLLEKAPLPAKLNCPFHSSRAPDLYSISVLPEQGKSLQCTSVSGFLNFLKVSSPSKSRMCMDAQLSCQNCIDLQVNRADSHPSCIIEIDLEKGYIQAPESEEEAVESLKREGLLARVFRRRASLKVVGKLMQLFFNHATSRADNPVIEKIHETPYNRWRRCKRTASFDSRKVVFLFSVLLDSGFFLRENLLFYQMDVGPPWLMDSINDDLAGLSNVSSLGTLVLIYLTLRVRQSADGFIRV